MSKNVVVLDYGSGNVHSAVKALAHAGAQVTLTSAADAVLAADGLLVPGVGAFDAVMQQLSSVSGAELISERLKRGKPVLGICVGQQVLFSEGTERDVTSAGLGFFSGSVASLGTRTLPHMGWNQVTASAESTIFSGIADEQFYFVHSNAATAMPAIQAEYLIDEELRITWAEHEGVDFIAALEAGPLSATQFHPEKSGAAGIKLLANWINSL